jgi:hypothetical protein
MPRKKGTERMDLVGHLAEALARGTSRRESFKTIAAGAFGLAAAWATQGPVGAGPLAKRCAKISSRDYCQPTNARYCDDPAAGGDKKNCNGATCANNCTVDDSFYVGPRQAGCWCTAVSGKGKNRTYFKCCDCLCPDIPPVDGARKPQGCSCRQRVFVNKDTSDGGKHGHHN